MALLSEYGLRRNLGRFLLDAFDGVLGAEPASEGERRDAFVSSNFLAGAFGVALWPLHWAVIGPVDFATGIAFFFLWTPLMLALYVRGGGELRYGEAASALCLGGFVTFAALLLGRLVFAGAAVAGRGA